MKMLFSGGGTAGHVNPAVAVAKRMAERLPSTETRFIGTPAGIESRLVPREGFKLYTMEMHGLSRAMNADAVKKNIKAVKESSEAVRKAKSIISEWRPDIVVGAGGYASFPAVRAAISLGIPTALLEVNALPGVSTRILASRANAVLLSFEAAAEKLPHAKRTVFTGSPVRGELLGINREDAKAALGLTDKPLVVSFWGSLGASGMNKKMLDFIELCDKDRSFYHIHAAGKNGYSNMVNELAARGIDINNDPPTDLREYIYDMARVMAAADVIICRGGASTMSELCAVGRASVIVPSPFVAENHQEANARALERHGAAKVVTEAESTGEILFRLTKELIDDKAGREEMEKRAREMAVTDATDRICDVLLEIVG